MRFICELPTEVQNEIRNEIKSIGEKIGLEFPYQADDITTYNNIDEYVNDIMREKLINVLGDNEYMLSWNKYKKYL